MTLPPPDRRVDPRDLKSGRTVADRNGYYDSQNIVVVAHPSVGPSVWSVVYHHSENREGGPGLRLLAVRSTDEGRTWTFPVEIDSPERQSHDGYQLVHRRSDGSDRILLFYGWNAGSWTPGMKRSDMQVDEGYWLRISDDGGATWGERRWQVPVRRTRIDRDNPWGGSTMGMFMCDPPSVIDGAVWMAFQKTVDGAGETPGSEVFFLRSADLLTVDDPADATWETLPDGDVGLQAHEGALRLGEEPHVLAVSSALPGRLCAMWRTEVGRVAESYSSDGGHTWEPVGWAAHDDGRPLRNPRGSFTPYRLRGDDEHPAYLMLHYNNGRIEREGYVGRRVYWYTIGRGGPDGRIRWSEAEVGLYWDGTGFEDRPGWNPDWAIVDGPGYPSFTELEDGRVVVVESNKLAVRLHEVEPRLLAALRGQRAMVGVPADAMVDRGATGTVVPAPVLPDVRSGGGFTVMVHVTGSRPDDGRLVSAWSDVTAALGEEPTDERVRKGYEVTVGDDGEVALWVSDGFGTDLRHRTGVGGAAGLWDGGAHTVSFVVDGGPRIVSVVVDEVLDDGGAASAQGWAALPDGLGEVGGSELQVHRGAARFLLFDRALLTTECIAAHRAFRA